MPAITRREFLRDAALLAAVGARPRAWRDASWRDTSWRAPVLRIGVVDDDSARATRMGVTLGIDEARHAAAMFGGGVQLITLAPRDETLPPLSAIIGDAAMSRVDDAHRAGVPYINVANTDDAWRGARCSAQLFHVTPSDAMARDAIARAGAGAAGTARVEAWDPSLEKFGADTLNQRFTSRFSQPMTSDAWTGWFAVKILWESSLRARSADAATIREYLSRDTTQFDGHKGRPLSFRPWDRQLRQPVYVVAGSRVIEWPPAPAGDETARQSLDAIGTPASASACRVI